MSAVRSSWLLKETFSTTSTMSLRPLSPQLQEKTNRELNENSSSVERDIQYIKEWLAKQPHLKARNGEITKTKITSTADYRILQKANGFWHSSEVANLV